MVPFCVFCCSSICLLYLNQMDVLSVWLVVPYQKKWNCTHVCQTPSLSSFMFLTPWVDYFMSINQSFSYTWGSCFYNTWYFESGTPVFRAHKKCELSTKQWRFFLCGVMLLKCYKIMWPIGKLCADWLFFILGRCLRMDAIRASSQHIMSGSTVFNRNSFICHIA